MLVVFLGTLSLSLCGCEIPSQNEKGIWVGCLLLTDVAGTDHLVLTPVVLFGAERMYTATSSMAVYSVLLYILFLPPFFMS